MTETATIRQGYPEPFLSLPDGFLCRNPKYIPLPCADQTEQGPFFLWWPALKGLPEPGMYTCYVPEGQWRPLCKSKRMSLG